MLLSCKMHNREGKLNQKFILPSPLYTSLWQNGGGERDRTDGLLRARQALSQLSYTPHFSRLMVVGLTGLEPVTSRLSGVRSNQN